jgi:hypothetical protein
LQAKFPDAKPVFLHRGGTLPFLAEWIIAQARIPYQDDQDAVGSVAQLKDYSFDLSTSNGVAELNALNTYVGAKKLLAGCDC